MSVFNKENWSFAPPTPKISVEEITQKPIKIAKKSRLLDCIVKNYNLWIKETFQPLRDSTQFPFPEKDSYCNNINSKVGVVTEIAGLYVPLVKYLRILGFWPVTLTRCEKTNFLKYQFTWLSPLTCYSIFMISFFTIASSWMFVSFLWMGFTQDFRHVLKFQGISISAEIEPTTSWVSEFGTRLLPATFPFFSIVSTVGTAMAMPNLFHLLNMWPCFQQDYLSVFPHRRNDDPFVPLRKFRNGTFLLYPVLAFGATVTVAFIISGCETLNGCIFPREDSTATTFATFATFTMLIMVGGHGCHFFMFRTLAEAFRQIWVGIEMWGKLEENKDKVIEPEVVQKWENLVIYVEEQVERTSKGVALHHVVVIFVNFLYLCLGVFSCLTPNQGEGNRGLIMLMFCSWGFSLLTVKAFMCENITKQEKIIVKQLRKLKVKDHLQSLVQINGLIDHIVREPAQIRFWNVVTLNKSFLVQLIGQVATYLIVLIQFDNMKR